MISEFSVLSLEVPLKLKFPEKVRDRFSFPNRFFNPRVSLLLELKAPVLDQTVPFEVLCKMSPAETSEVF